MSCGRASRPTRPHCRMLPACLPPQVVSCSQFEAHAGRGSRRAPYDNIFTTAGVTLKAIAASLPELPDEAAAGGEYGLPEIVDG